jgi:ethanolamine utilization protein EutQ (cupin superfamily)
VKIHVVLAGELVVTVDRVATTAGPGDTIAVQAGTTARYEAPLHARMLYIYGPGPRGATDVLCQDLSG